MLDFVARVFRGWITIILWLLIIGGAILGGAIGSLAGGGYAFFLFLVGGFIGFIFAVLFGGLISNFLNMVDNIEKLVKGNTSLSTGNISATKDLSSYNWVCKKCGNTNNSTALFCNNCGEKK